MYGLTGQEDDGAIHGIIERRSREYRIDIGSRVYRGRKRDRGRLPFLLRCLRNCERTLSAAVDTS